MIMVTGGAGFIGSNVVAALEDRGEPPIVVCDRLRTGPKWRNLAKRELADLVHPDRLHDWLDERGGSLEAIVHMGAVSSTTETDADRVIENNFRLSLALWRWCVREGVRFVYASSAATYGDGSEGFSDEASPGHLSRLRPLNPYGWSKHLFDRRVARIVEEGGPTPPQWAGLKFFNVYGPNEYHKGPMKSVVAQIHPDAAAGGPVRLFESHHPDYPDGGQMRDFVHVDDGVGVVLWLLDHPEVDGLFNVGSGTARTFEDLARAVFESLGSEPRIEYVPTPEQIRDRYQYFTKADMRKLREAGYPHEPIPLEDGVRSYVQEYLEAEDPFR